MVGIVVAIVPWCLAVGLDGWAVYCLKSVVVVE